MFLQPSNRELDVNNVENLEFDSKSSSSLVCKESTRQKTPNDKNDSFVKKESLNSIKNKGKSSAAKRVNLVNDGYLSEDEADTLKIKEMVVENVKVQLDLDLNSVKVRSKWDSDYEGENSEKEGVIRTEVDMEIATSEEDNDNISTAPKEIETPKSADVNQSNQISEPVQGVNYNQSCNVFNDAIVKNETILTNASNQASENLASEYEEFLKMVSFDSNLNENTDKIEKAPEESAQPEKLKISNSEIEQNEKENFKIQDTDWDRESDHEGKLKTRVTNSIKSTGSDLFPTNENNTEIKIKEENKKADVNKKEKLDKMSNKEKNTKYESTSSSDDSSSDFYESESETESDKSKTSKKKKKKINKAKKKNKNDSSTSESESSSDSYYENKKSKEKKAKKKKPLKKISSYADSDDEKSDAFLRHLKFKNDLLLRKIEETDAFIEKNKGEKKQKRDNESKSDDKNSFDKLNKNKKSKKSESTSKEKSKKSLKSTKKSKSTKGRSSSSSDESESTDSSGKSPRKKDKMKGKKKRSTSNTSDSDGKTETDYKKQNYVGNLDDVKYLKSLENINEKIKKGKQNKRYDSSDSDSESSASDKNKKPNDEEFKTKITEDLDKENAYNSGWRENFLLQDSFDKSNRLNFTDREPGWKRTTPVKVSKKKKKKELKEDDWETSSSDDYSDAERENKKGWSNVASSDVKQSDKMAENFNIFNGKEKFNLSGFEQSFDSRSIVNSSEIPVPSAFAAMKNSLSNFSFNENSFCSFGQELSRDFFLTEQSISNATEIRDDGNVVSTSSELRPFQSVGKQNEMSVHSKSELYSPGHSYSEASDLEDGNKPEKRTVSKDDVYDPLNTDSETSAENADVELNKIPLPRITDIILPGETRFAEDVCKFSALSNNKSTAADVISSNSKQCSSPDKSFPQSDNVIPLSTVLLQDSYKSSLKKQVINVKPQQKLISKAASVFQDESDEENVDINNKKGQLEITSHNEIFEKSEKQLKEDVNCKLQNADLLKVDDKEKLESEKSLELNEKIREKNDNLLRQRQRSISKEKTETSSSSSSHRKRKKRSLSKEDGDDKSRRKDKDSGKEKKSRKSSKNRKSRTPEPSYKTNNKADKREIRSDSFEIEPLKGSSDYKDLEETVRPIPVLTGLNTSSDCHFWNKSHLVGYSSVELSDSARNLIDSSESFDIYPSDEVKFRNNNYDKISADHHYKESHDKFSGSKSKEERRRKERRSKSKSLSPKRRNRSRTPDKRKSPRVRSPRRRSPKRRDRSSYSPRRRSPKRKSPMRRYRCSKSPDRRRKSRSRSPRKRNSQSLSPKRRDSPRKRNSSARGYSPRRSVSPPRNENRFSQHYSESFRNKISVIERMSEDSKVNSNSTSFSRMSDDIINETDMNFYGREYPPRDFGYSDDLTGGNLITVKNHEFEKPNSPERLSLDQRIELELGVSMGSNSQGPNDQYHICKQFQDINSGHYSNSYNCENNHSGGSEFYQNHHHSS